MTFIKKGSIHSRRIGREIILYDEKNNKVHTLNESASIIWEMLNRGAEPLDICKKITSQFKVKKEEALKDIHKTISKFKKLKLIDF